MPPIKTNDELLFEAISRSLQATFEAINDLVQDLSEPRKKQLYAKTDRILRTRHQLEALLDERRG